MLILTRKPGESIYIGDDVKVTIVEIKGHQIRVGIDAPAELRIYREEIYLQILEENKQAAESSDAGLEGLTAAWKEGRNLGAGTGAGTGKPAISKLSGKRGKGNDPSVVVKKKGKKPNE